MKRFSSVCLALALSVVSSSTFAAVMTAGNLAVYRVGDGTAALSAAATKVFVDEYQTNGTPGTSIPLPSTGASSLTGSGTAAEGFLTLATQGRYLMLQGYGADAGTGAIASSTTATAARVVGRIDLQNGAIDTSTRLTDAFSGNSIRAVTSDDGNNLWSVGGGGSGTRYATLGSTTSTALHTTPTAIRDINIFNSDLYFTSASATFVGINKVSGGLATTTGQTATLFVPITGGTGTPSPYDFWFADANTVYVADDRTIANGGGAQKWTFNGSTWNLAYTLTTGITVGLRGLAGTTDINGNNVIYVTTNKSSNNEIMALTDTGAASSFGLVTSAGTNKLFRGIEIVPEPTTVCFLALGGLLMRRVRRVTA